MATLKSLVDETTDIKNELKTCHVNLKNNLIAKGVECSDNDKMSSLIDKVNGITIAQITAGDSILMYCDSSGYSYGEVSAGYFGTNFEYVFKAHGDYRLSINCKSSIGGSRVYIKFVILDENNLIIDEKAFSTVNSYFEEVFTDVIGVKKGHKATIMVTGPVNVWVNTFKVLCNLDFR